MQGSSHIITQEIAEDVRSKAVEILSGTSARCFSEFHQRMLNRIQELENHNHHCQAENVKLFQENEKFALTIQQKNEQLKSLPMANQRIHELEKQTRTLTTELNMFRQNTTEAHLYNELNKTYWAYRNATNDITQLQNYIATHINPPAHPAYYRQVPSNQQFIHHPSTSTGAPQAPPGLLYQIPPQSVDQNHVLQVDSPNEIRNVHPPSVIGQGTQNQHSQHTYSQPRNRRKPVSVPVSRMVQSQSAAVATNGSAQPNQRRASAPQMTSDALVHRPQERRFSEIRGPENMQESALKFGSPVNHQSYQQQQHSRGSKISSSPSNYARSPYNTQLLIKQNQLPLSINTTPMPAPAIDNVQLPCTPQSAIKTHFPSSSPSPTIPFYQPDIQLLTPPASASLDFAYQAMAMVPCDILPSNRSLSYPSRRLIELPQHTSNLPNNVTSNISSTVETISSPANDQETAKRSNAEVSPELSDPTMDSRKKRRIEEDIKPCISNDAMEDSADAEEDSFSDVIEVDSDGLRLVSDCIAALMTDHEDGAVNPRVMNCRLCLARHNMGYIEEPPKPFINATDEELLNHCVSEHIEAWEEIRHKV